MKLTQMLTLAAAIAAGCSSDDGGKGSDSAPPDSAASDLAPDLMTPDTVAQPDRCEKLKALLTGKWQCTLNKGTPFTCAFELESKGTECRVKCSINFTCFSSLPVTGKDFSCTSTAGSLIECTNNA